MALLEKLKAALGLDSGSGDEDGAEGVGVTVERESGMAATAGGSEPDLVTPGETLEDDSATDHGEAATAATDAETTTPASTSTEDTGKETGEQSEATKTHAESAEEADVSEADEPDSEPATTEGESTTTEGESTTAEIIPDDETTTDDEGRAGGDSTPVDEIKGIGPSYADQLERAGVETVGDLSKAEPEELAESTEISRKRLQRWIDRARNR